MTPNTAATNEVVDDFATDFAAATLTIKEGATTLATHTLAGFGAAASGTAAANAIADATIAASGTADSAVLTAGALEYQLTVGTSGADVNLSTLTFVSGETSSITALTVSA